MSKKISLFLIVWEVIFIFVFVSAVKADRASSTNFIIESAVIDTGGENATSASFQIPSALSQPALGFSTSGSFRILGGFLAFPFVTEPVLSVIAGVQQATLTWTASEGFLGFNVSGYDVGVGLISGGQSFENVGNVLSFVKTGLVGGQTHFFKVRAKDEFGEVIAVSDEVFVTPTAAAVTPIIGGSGGIRFLYLPPLPPILPAPGTCLPAEDLNCDGKVNLKDFSIFLFLMPSPAPDNPADFNKNSFIDTQDLSILFSGWTDKIPSFISDRTFFAVKTAKKSKKSPDLFAIISRVVEPSAAVSPLPAILKEQKEIRPSFLERTTMFFFKVAQKTTAWFKRFWR